MIALVFAALALFFVGPMLLGIGGDDGGGGAAATPRPTAAAATPTAAPTVPPAPTPQVYVVAKGDTMSRIAKKFGVTVDQILAANPQIKNPDKIKEGDEDHDPGARGGRPARRRCGVRGALSGAPDGRRRRAAARSSASRASG